MIDSCSIFIKGLRKCSLFPGYIINEWLVESCFRALATPLAHTKEPKCIPIVMDDKLDQEKPQVFLARLVSTTLEKVGTTQTSLSSEYVYVPCIARLKSLCIWLAAACIFLFSFRERALRCLAWRRPTPQATAGAQVSTGATTAFPRTDRQTARASVSAASRYLRQY